MQLLTFTVAGETYAIESRAVVEVLPLVPARPLPLAPDYVRGVFTCRGGLVPLIDLARRMAGPPPAERLSTRVIVVAFVPAAGREPVRLGIIAENVISIATAEDAVAALPRLELPDAPFLGRVLRLEGRTVQVVDVARLLPAEIAAGLFPDPVGAPRP